MLNKSQQLICIIINIPIIKRFLQLLIALRRHLNEAEHSVRHFQYLLRFSAVYSCGKKECVLIEWQSGNYTYLLPLNLN